MRDAAVARARDIALHIARRQTCDAAHDRHCRRKRRAVPLSLVEQEPGDEVPACRGNRLVERIGIVLTQKVRNALRALIGGGGILHQVGHDAHDLVLDGLGIGGVRLADGGPVRGTRRAVARLRAALGLQKELVDAGVVRGGQGRRDGICVARLRVMRDEDLGAGAKVGHEALCGGDVCQTLGDEEC